MAGVLSRLWDRSRVRFLRFTPLPARVATGVVKGQFVRHLEAQSPRALDKPGQRAVVQLA